jgi:hypothetical protein
MWHFAYFQFADPMFFVICGFVIYGFAICGPKFFCCIKTSASPQMHTFSPFPHNNVAYNALIQICTVQIKQLCKKTTFKTVLRQNWQHFVEICGFALCRLIKNLRIEGGGAQELSICDLGQKKKV